jgi:hypothetical protein
MEYIKPEIINLKNSSEINEKWLHGYSGDTDPPLR